MPAVDPVTRNILLVVLAALMLITGGAWATFQYVLPAIGKGLGQAAGDAFMQSDQIGAYSAASAASLAQADHISYSTLSMSTLNAKRADETWVSATTEVLMSGNTKKFVVSFEGADFHFVTAVMLLDQCVYGLSVSSAADPVIRRDDLPGVGTYFNSAAAPFGSVGAPAVCDAATAPAVGWTRANPATMRELSQGQ